MRPGQRSLAPPPPPGSWRGSPAPAVLLEPPKGGAAVIPGGNRGTEPSILDSELALDLAAPPTYPGDAGGVT